MSETATPAPAATPAAPPPANGASGAQKSAPSPAQKFVQGEAAKTVTPVRNPDGKFASTDPKPAEVAPAPKAKLRIKDLELDEDAAYAEVQRGRQASKLLTEAQKRAAQSEASDRERQEELAALKKDPRSLVKLLKKSGLTDQEIRQHLMDLTYSEVVEPEQLTAEQKRIRELEGREAERAAKDNEAAEKQRQEQDAKDDEAAAQSLEQEIMAAIDAGKIPPAKGAVRRIAQKVAALESRGLNLPLEQVAQLVRHEVGQEMSEFVAAAEVGDLKELMGPQVFREHVRKVVAWVKQQTSPGPLAASAQKPKVAQPARAEQKLTPQQFEARMRALSRGKG